MGPIVNDLIFSKAWRYRLTRHTLFWLFSIAVFVRMDSVYTHSAVSSIKAGLTFLPFDMLYVYVVIYGLVRRKLMRAEYLSFGLWFVGWLLANLLLDFFWRYYLIYHTSFTYAWSRPGLRHALPNIFDINIITSINVAAGAAIWISLYKYWQIEVWQKMRIRQEKTKAELELLKAQLHPHFLFNTLNNLYALVVGQSDKAPQALMRLSAILSYVLYECRSAEVPLEREISVCRDYIELERERYGDRLDVSLDFSGTIEGKKVAPMLFQPFIESAFRHGPSEHLGKVWMSIGLSVRQQQLFFRVIHSGDFELHRPDADSPAIRNIIRRLELLYPGAHSLTREMGDGVYIVSLTIDLKSTARTDLGPADPKTQPVQYENAVFNY